MVSIKSFTFNAFMENTYLLYDESKECVVIDPGCYDERERAILAAFIESEGLKVVKLLNTHCHIDHVLGNAFVKEKYKTHLYVHPTDEATLKSVEVYAPAYGFQHYQATTIDHYLEVPGEITFGNTRLEILFTPGHAPGHVVFYHPEQKFCIGGDVLFQGSIGRTDLPGGDYDTLIRSIFEQIYPLGDDVTIYPGHGAKTSVGYEKAHNPFCAVK